MSQSLVDFSFLHEVSGMEGQYISDVIDIFFSVMPEGLKKLADLVEENKNWEAIYKQAHFLKSSVSVIKVEGMYDRFYEIEVLGRKSFEAKKAKEKVDKKAVKEAMTKVMHELQSLFAVAEPVIVAEKNKYAK